jgi:mono/diheme cytochrome c family protein
MKHLQKTLLSRKILIAVSLLAALSLLAGCAQTGQMAYMPRYDVYEPGALFADGNSARPLPEGVVAYTGEESPDDPARTGLTEDGEPLDSLPVEVDMALVARGKERYDIFCEPCHGTGGAGNGMATTYGFPAPPNLLSSDLSDGEMFEIITHGRGLMFPYGYRVKPADRWAVIAYTRALQLKQGPVNPQDLTPEELNQLGGQP